MWWGSVRGGGGRGSGGAWPLTSDCGALGFMGGVRVQGLKSYSQGGESSGFRGGHAHRLSQGSGGGHVYRLSCTAR